MGALYLDGIAIGDDGRDAYLPDDIRAEYRAVEAEKRARGEAVMRDAIDRMQAPARTLAAKLTKNRARAFLRHPWQLDMIFPGLSMRRPEYVIAVVSSEQERVDRFVGFSGTVRPANLRGALLYARYERRRERAATMATAAE